ncbi:MAG TPA: FecR domain-containing protein [Gemmatimonadaceae bacterium]|nr:FecR domain-containing protein [Gemmatimonadaceae bacterium]
MTEHFDWSIVDRFLAGEATSEEMVLLQRWLEGDPRRGQLLDEARQAVSAETRSWDVDTAWRNVSKGMLEPAATTVIPIHTRRPRRYKGLLRIAAGLVLTLSAAMLWRMMSDRGSSSTQVAMREVATTKGQRAELRLSDGTRVVLGAASRLEYAPDMGSKTRDVRLIGEAYFEVAPDSVHPFVVHTAGAMTRVLGTEFAVRAYAGTDEVQVAVAGGRVLLTPADSSSGVVLIKGQLGALRAGGKPTVRAISSLEPFVGWTEGRLAFDAMPLRDALRQLERWYDVNFVVADSGLADRRLTARFKAESLTEALDAIALALDARYERRDRTITFVPR